MLNDVLIIDDHSTDPETLQLLRDQKIGKVFYKQTNQGIRSSLNDGYDMLFETNDVVINLDADAIVRKDFISRLMEVYKPGYLLTGFHSTTRNADGSERHQILHEGSTHYFKKSVGGINMVADKFTYENYIKPSLQILQNWDHASCLKSGGAMCLKESVIEHIGFDSAMGHIEQPDVASNFYYHNLPDVTLLAIDGRGAPKEAIQKTTSRLKFGAVKVIDDPKINSVEKYSEWVIKHAADCVETSHMLIIQHDGYVINPNEWDNSWLQYDYIGATWWYEDGMNVGNGGFSLRSKRLMQLAQTICMQTHPEDHHICRTYRRELEEQGMKFAPDEVADKFSYEGYRQPGKFLNGQFGFHRAQKTTTPTKPVNRQKLVIGQFASLGDILWLVPLVRALQDEGNTCLWPVNTEYLSLRKHFPDLNFVDKNLYPLPYESQVRVHTNFGTWLPYRYASENMGRTLKQCMQSKYELYGHSWNMFRMLTWHRDMDAERRLYGQVVRNKPYILVNRYYGAQGQFQITPQLPVNANVVEMRPMGGFTMLDWGMVLEGASETHSANTSLLYMLERMHLDMPVHLYSRNGLWGEIGFSYTQFLHSKSYILHQ